MTEEERNAILLADIERRHQLARDIEILENELKQAGRDIERFGRTLSDNPSNVRPSVREHSFEYSTGGAVKVNFEAVRKMVGQLAQARDDLVSANAALEPRIGW